MADPQIEGLPEGAIVKPIQDAQVSGLPPGAIVRPIGEESSADASDDDVAARHARSAQGEGINYGQPGTDFATQHPYLAGAAKGIAGTLEGPLGFIKPGPASNPTDAENSKESIGKGIERAGEFFMLPGGPEADGLLGGAGRITTSAIGSGLLNKAQGGSFKSGALAGGAVGGVGEGLRAAAPSLAEGALGVTRKMRAFGRTPGKAVLEETSANIPGNIAEQAENRLGSLTAELNSRAADSNVPASTKPAIDVIDKEQIKAIKQNNQTRYNMLHDLRQQLTTEFSTGDPIPRNVPPSQILNLKRGIGDLETTWNPELRSGIRPVIRKVYSALDKELDRTVPGSDELNQRISSLIPAAQRAKSTEQAAALPQRVGHRIFAHAGSLTPSALGAGIGYERGGSRGAIAGGLTGLVLPEILSSPTAQMFAARAANSPIPARLGRAIIPVGRKLANADEPEQ